MRWLLIGLFTLNLLQAIYIFLSKPVSSPSDVIEAPSLSNSTANQPSGVAVLAHEVRLVSRSLVNELVESGKGINTVRFAMWPKGGFMATYVKQASIISQLGLMKGDIVKSINKTQMLSVLHALSVYQNLEDLHLLELGIERQGQAMSYFYKLVD
jgi:type II secretory pathway component PulC